MSDLTVERFLVSSQCREWLDGCARRIGAHSFEAVFGIGQAMAEEGRASPEPDDRVRAMFNGLRDAIASFKRNQEVSADVGA